MNNLKLLRETLGFQKQKDFAKELDMPPNTYNNYEKGIRDPNSDFWILLAEKYQVSIDWLMGLSDDPHRVKFAAPSALEQKYRALDEHGKKVVDFIIDAETERMTESKRETVVIDLGTIRRYLSRPAAGPGGLVEGEDYEDIPRTKDMPKGADFCLVVSGDSMEPYIKAGETVYVSESAELKPYDVGVWFVDGATYVKQYEPNDDGSLHLLSANPKRKAANLVILPSGNQNVQYFGKVIGLKKLPKPVYNGKL